MSKEACVLNFKWKWEHTLSLHTFFFSINTIDLCFIYEYHLVSIYIPGSPVQQLGFVWVGWCGPFGRIRTGKTGDCENHE